MWLQEKGEVSPFTTGIRKLLCQYPDSCACVGGVLPKWLTHSASKIRGVFESLHAAKTAFGSAGDHG